jgi:plasmid stabilization system protein ParE
MVEKFYQAFQLLAENPAIGHTRTDLTDLDVRFWSVKPRYHVIYSVQFQSLLIVRVLPADLDIAREMKSTRQP